MIHGVWHRQTDPPEDVCPRPPRISWGSSSTEEGDNFGGDDSTREHPVDPALAVDMTKPLSELYAEIKVIPNFAR